MPYLALNMILKCIITVELKCAVIGIGFKKFHEWAIINVGMRLPNNRQDWSDGNYNDNCSETD